MNFVNVDDGPERKTLGRGGGSRELSRYWDHVARKMPDILPAASTQYYRQREIALIKDHFGPLEGKRVLKLDLWNEAVNTRILNWMASQGAEAFGLDVSYITASRAQRNSASVNGHLRPLQSDMQFIPFPENTFDFVYSMGTIEHIDGYEATIAEASRVLKVGGRAIIGVPHKWDLFLRPLLVRALTFIGKYLYAPERSLSAGDLKRAVERSGLRVRSRTGILLMPGLLRMADLFFYSKGIFVHKLTPLLLWPFEQLECRWDWARRLGYLLVLVAEKTDAQKT